MCVCVIFEIEKTENANERINENEGNKISRVKKKKENKNKKGWTRFYGRGKVVLCAPRVETITRSSWLKRR